MRKWVGKLVLGMLLVGLVLVGACAAEDLSYAFKAGFNEDETVFYVKGKGNIDNEEFCKQLLGNKTVGYSYYFYEIDEEGKINQIHDPSITLKHGGKYYAAIKKTLNNNDVKKETKQFVVQIYNDLKISTNIPNAVSVGEYTVPANGSLTISVLQGETAEIKAKPIPNHTCKIGTSKIVGNMKEDLVVDASYSVTPASLKAEINDNAVLSVSGGAILTNEPISMEPGVALTVNATFASGLVNKYISKIEVLANNAVHTFVENASSITFTPSAGQAYTIKATVSDAYVALNAQQLNEKATKALLLGLVDNMYSAPMITDESELTVQINKYEPTSAEQEWLDADSEEAINYFATDPATIHVKYIHQPAGAFSTKVATEVLITMATPKAQIVANDLAGTSVQMNGEEWDGAERQVSVGDATLSIIHAAENMYVDTVTIFDGTNVVTDKVEALETYTFTAEANKTYTVTITAKKAFAFPSEIYLGGYDASTRDAFLANVESFTPLLTKEDFDSSHSIETFEVKREEAKNNGAAYMDVEIYCHGHQKPLLGNLRVQSRLYFVRCETEVHLNDNVIYEFAFGADHQTEIFKKIFDKVTYIDDQGQPVTLLDYDAGVAAYNAGEGTLVTMTGSPDEGDAEFTVSYNPVGNSPYGFSNSTATVKVNYPKAIIIPGNHNGVGLLIGADAFDTQKTVTTDGSAVKITANLLDNQNKYIKSISVVPGTNTAAVNTTVQENTISFVPVSGGVYTVNVEVADAGFAFKSGSDDYVGKNPDKDKLLAMLDLDNSMPVGISADEVKVYAKDADKWYGFDDSSAIELLSALYSSNKYVTIRFEYQPAPSTVHAPVTAEITVKTEKDLVHTTVNLRSDIEITFSENLTAQDILKGTNEFEGIFINVVDADGNVVTASADDMTITGSVTAGERTFVVCYPGDREQGYQAASASVTVTILRKASTIDVQYVQYEYDGSKKEPMIVAADDLSVIKVIVDPDKNINIILPEEIYGGTKTYDITVGIDDMKQDLSNLDEEPLKQLLEIIKNIQTESSEISLNDHLPVDPGKYTVYALAYAPNTIPSRDFDHLVIVGPTATPEATPTATPEATPTATPEVTPTATPEATPTATPEVTPTATPEATPTATPEATPTATPEATPTATPEATPTATLEATPTATPEATPTATPEATPTEIPEATPTATPEAFPTATPETTPTAEPEGTPEPTLAPTATPVVTAEPAATEEPTATPKPLPETGDSSHMALWMMLMIVSGAALLLICRRMTANGR